MIQSLSIQNFKSHKDTNLEFAPGVNVIVGMSDSGKSNILRSLNWLLYNRPLGDGFIHWGEQEASVSLTTESNNRTVKVVRTRSKSENTYVLEADGKKISFTAFGDSPPQEIVETLNFDDINIQSQFDPYFLVFKSPGVIATYIRSITGLEKLDAVSDLLSGRIRQAKTTVSGKEEELQIVDSKLQEVEKINLDRLRCCLLTAETKLKKVDELTTKKNRLLILSQQIAQLEAARIVLPEKRLLEIKASKEKFSQEYLQLINSRSRLSSILSALEKVESAITLPEGLEDILLRAGSLRKEYNEKCQQLQKLFVLVDKITKTTVEVEGLSHERITVAEQVKNLKEMLTVCPNCGSELTSDTKQNLLKGFSCA